MLTPLVGRPHGFDMADQAEIPEQFYIPFAQFSDGQAVPSRSRLGSVLILLSRACLKDSAGLVTPDLCTGVSPR
jgi:hypothetical protein